MTNVAARVIIVGGGSQGAIVADILACAGTPAIGFVDDTPSLRSTSILGLPILGAISALQSIDHDAIIVAIGDNRARHDVTDRLVGRRERLTTAVHPFSSIAESAVIGDGSMISAGALVLPRAIIGRGVLLNTKSSVDHDSVLGDFAHVSAGATVGAQVVIGEETLIALGACVASRMRIGARTIIGAGSVVVTDIGDGVTAFGVPARVRS